MTRRAAAGAPSAAGAAVVAVGLPRSEPGRGTTLHAQLPIGEAA
jgi:hypothetical protein